MKMAYILATTILLTVILLQFKNKSNISSLIVVPLIVSLLIKYLIGDLDEGYIWSLSDISYWTLVVGVSMGLTYWLTELT